MLDKNTQIVKFIVERLSRKVGRVYLLKLVYLGDYFSHRLLGKPVSSFRYILYEHGPFDKKFYDCISKLKEADLIREEQVCFPAYQGYHFHDVPKAMKFDLSNSERYILEFVIRTFGKVSLDDLLEEIVYKTEPMVEAIGKKAYGSELDMDQVNYRDKEMYQGLNPEDIIEGEKAIAEGRICSLDEFFSAI
ncbi:MAG: Panacea domain-containing protein [Candidatus Brocadiales bacterium]